jgi:hypothetical protein
MEEFMKNFLMITALLTNVAFGSELGEGKTTECKKGKDGNRTTSSVVVETNESSTQSTQGKGKGQ